MMQIQFGSGKYGNKTAPTLLASKVKKRKRTQTPKFELVNGTWQVTTGAGRYLFESYERLVCGLADMEYLGIVPKGTVKGLRK